MKPQSMASKAWALLPVKAPQWAKSRLSSLFSADERAALQLALLKDVLKSLSRARTLEGIAVICSDPSIGATAQGLGTTFIAEYPATGDLNRALAMGARRLREAGAGIIAVIPADLPLIEAADVDRAVREAVRRQAMIVVPDRFRQGTNGLIFPAGMPPEFNFGPDSFHRHLSRPSRQPAVSMEFKSLALDIEMPEDIERLCAAQGSQGAAETMAMIASAAACRKNPVCVDV
jgi:2-phospho-L-lactate guanylyltransferase